MREQQPYWIVPGAGWGEKQVCLGAKGGISLEYKASSCWSTEYAGKAQGGWFRWLTALSRLHCTKENRFERRDTHRAVKEMSGG